MQHISVLEQVEDRIVESSLQGGCVAYDNFPRFHSVIAEDSSQTVLAALEEYIMPLVSYLESELEQVISVLDVCCSRGHVLLYLAGRYPNSEFFGYEFSAEALTIARQHAEKKCLSNVTYIERDLGCASYLVPTVQSFAAWYGRLSYCWFVRL